jgi:hypothetical protein
MDEVMEMLRVTSLVVLAVAVLSGLLMKRWRAELAKTHRVVGSFALAVAVCHGTLSMLD